MSDVHALTGAYAVDALVADERHRYERHLAACGPCRQEVAELQATAAQLGRAASEPAPPGLRDRVLAGLADTPQRAVPAQPEPQRATPAAPAARTASRRLLTAVAALLAAALIGLAAVGLQTTARIRGLEDALAAQATDQRILTVLTAVDAQIVTLDAPAGAVARFLWSDQRDEGVFLADGLQPPPSGHSYALWLLEDRAPPRLAGLLRPGPDGRAVEVVESAVAAAERVGVTVEPEGPVLAPTSAPIVAGALA